jgi:putative DNA primase/helicase
MTATTLADMTREFLDAITGFIPPSGEKRYLTGAVGHGGRYTSSGSYEFTKFEPFAYEWPGQCVEAITWIQKHEAVADVYICPYLQKTRERKKWNAAWRQLVHCDCDKSVDLQKVYQLGGFVIWSGTPGHGHVYVLLTHAVMPAQHEALEHGLIAYLDGDPAKFNDNDLLRPSGSHNQKAAASGGTAGFVVPAGTLNVGKVDPFELGKALGIDINAATPPVTPNITIDASEREQVDLSQHPSVIDALLKITNDRSDDTYFVVAACREAGLNLPKTRWVVDSRTDLKDRLAGRNDDDVLTCWNRHASATAWIGATPPTGGLSAAPPPQPGAPAPPAPPGPGRFFGKQGLRALDLTNEVMATVTCGYGWLDERFYTYDGGVWTPGDGPIEAEITRLLGNRYRPNHTRNVTTIAKHLASCAHITDEPLADYINVVNGMVRWDSGQILPHDPAHLSTVQLPVEYVPGATCPRFEKFLREVLPADLVDSGFIWELIGYTLYSGNPLHVAVLLFGKGRNGKGVLIRVLKELLGERNISAVTLHELTENRFRVATLYQKLANLAGDLDSKWLENTALFKKITGHDTLQGEYKYGAAFNFDPWALPFYSANKAFGSPDSSEGWVARWIVVPFPNSFLGREDRTLDVKLTSESELRGILARAVAALPALMARGNFADLISLQEAKQAFVLASDAVRAWLDECAEIEPSAWTPRFDLYRAYRQHTMPDGGKQLGAREFYNRVEQVQGVVSAVRQGTRGFGGVRLRPGWNWQVP